MNPLRDYQRELYVQTREALRTHRAVCVQSPTGSGKTPLIAAMCESVYGRDKRAWIIVNREELVSQTSAHLSKWRVPHSKIIPGQEESKAFKIHVVSTDTLIRRYDRIKNWPDLCIIDECHLLLDRQIKLAELLPESSKIIGLTATPERADTRGLSTQAGGIYDSLIEGPSIPWLTERGFLTPLRYFAPPLEGLDAIKRTGTDLDEEQLEELLQRRKVYGQVVDHYARYGKGRQALIFCRGVKSAEQTAERFRDRGFKFYRVDGNTPKAKRRELIDALRAGKIDGLCGADVFLFGLDAPRVSYGASIRPTTSRQLYMQAIGRIIRPFTDIDGTVKQDALFFDHCNMILDHQEPSSPGVPLHYVPRITWNFHGIIRRKREKNQNIKLCPHLDYFYCPHGRCATCKHNPDGGAVSDARKPMVVIPAELNEIKKPIPLNERLPEERREIQDRIGEAVLQYKSDPKPSVVEELLKIADGLGYKDLWVYHRLTDASRYSVDVSLLSEIARIRGYKPGWVYFARQKLKKGA